MADVRVDKDILGRFFAHCGCNWVSHFHLRYTQAADAADKHNCVKYAHDYWTAADDLADRELQGVYDENGQCWRCLTACRGTICVSCLVQVQAEQERREIERPTRQNRAVGY